MWVLLGDLMDKRKLKKHVLFDMLSQYQSIWKVQDEDAKRESAELVMDIPYGKKILMLNTNAILWLWINWLMTRKKS